MGKKDLAMMAMSYGNVYVGKVSIGANDAHTVKVFKEAEAYDGPSIIIAYCHCIAHGIDMGKRPRPAEARGRIRPLDAHALTTRTSPKKARTRSSSTAKSRRCRFEDYIYNEVRYKSLKTMNKEEAAALSRRREAVHQGQVALLQAHGRNEKWTTSPKD